MMNDEPPEEKGNGFWLGMVIGGLLGAAVSFFVTADEKQKKKLLAKGRQIIDHLEDFKEEVEDKGQEIKEAVEERVESLPKDARKAIKKIASSKKFFIRKGKSLAKR